MQANYKIRNLLPEDTREVLELLTISLKGSIGIPRTEEYWRWKHEKNPFGVSYGIVAESEGKIIGIRTFMRWLWTAGDGRIAAARAVDTVTHPDWQGQGIFSRLTSTLLKTVADEGVAFIFNTPNASSKPGYLKLGWQVLTKLPLRIRPDLSGIIRDLIHPQSAAIPGSPVADVLRNADLEKCLTGMAGDTRFHTERTRRYLSWRYGEIPGLSYYCAYQQSGGGAALLIFRNRKRKGLHELRICELLASEGKSGERVAQELIRETVGKIPAAYCLAIAADRTVEQASLSRSFFIPTPPFGPTVTIRPLNGPALVSDWKNWRCSIGDFELF